MMRAPMASSQTYRENGRPHAVYWLGMVLFMTPSEYAKLRQLDPERQYRDATEAEIARHDAWYERACREMEQERSELRRLFGFDRCGLGDRDT